MEPADLWQRYLETRYQDRAIRIENDHNGERLIIAEQVVLPGGLAGLGGTNLRPLTSATTAPSWVKPAARSPRVRLGA